MVQLILQAEGLVSTVDQGVDFDKTLAVLPLKILLFMPNKDFIPLPH